MNESVSELESERASERTSKRVGRWAGGSGEREGVNQPKIE